MLTDLQYRSRIKAITGENFQNLNTVGLISYLRKNYPNDTLTFTSGRGLKEVDFHGLTEAFSFVNSSNLSTYNASAVVHKRRYGGLSSLCGTINAGQTRGGYRPLWYLTEDEVTCKRCLKRMG